MKSERINPTKLESGHMQIIPACGTFGNEQIRKEIFYEELKKHCGGLIKPKFSINDTVETIPEYANEYCPYVKGEITSIDHNLGSVVYLIGDTWIYEKWLRKVE